MSESAQSERRRHPRYEVLAQVRVRRADTDYVLEVKNLSQSGALVELGDLARPTWVKVGRTLELTLFVPDEDESTDVSGTVRRVVEEVGYAAFAVEFTALSDEAQKYLARLLGPDRPVRKQPPPLPT